MVLSFHCEFYQVTSAQKEPRRRFFIYFLICSNMLSSPNPRKAFQCTVIPPQQGGQLHTKLTPTFSQLHELQPVPYSISALPLPIQFKHKKHQKKSTMNSKLTLPSAQPMTSPSVPPATKQFSTCSRKRPEAKQLYPSGRELQRTRSSPQCLRTSEQRGVCSVKVEVNKPCACSTSPGQSDEGEKSYLI